MENKMLITPLGAGGEVGRSCITIEFKGKKIMLDCGIHPAFKGFEALPFFDLIEPETIDFILVSHFHLDHIAALPYFTENTKFQGRVFMTHATRAIGILLIRDYVRVSHLSDDDMLFNEADLQKCFGKVEVIDFHQEIDVDGVKISCHHAGHVLGGAMFNIEIAGVKLLYTGDYSREEDRHLPAAELPIFSPQVMICESTYGIKYHEPLPEREARFTRLVRDIVTRGGRCLIPVFASGRAQELLLILDEYWKAHPELNNIPIYYASALANKCMSVYQTFINMMNNRIRKQFPMVNPFKFTFIESLKNTDQFHAVGPCVMMASPGMLQSGMSRELFEAWCPDEKNGIIIPGYCVEGTLAKTILSNPKEITTMDGKKLPLRMSVDYISFSAHVDYAQNSSYIKEVNPSTLILVHGDSYEMERLKKTLEAEYREMDRSITIHTPPNGHKVALEFKGEKNGKIIGQLASSKPVNNKEISGILAVKDFETVIMSPDDLAGYDLSTSVITQRLIIPYSVGSMSLLEYHLSQMYDSVVPISGKSRQVEQEDDGKEGLRVFDTVNIFPHENGSSVILEWIGNSMNDMVADSILAVILRIEQSPSSIKALQSLQDGSLVLKREKNQSEQKGDPTKNQNIKEEIEKSQYITDENIQNIHEMLLKHFDTVEISSDDFSITIKAGKSMAVFKPKMNEVVSEDLELKKRVSRITNHIFSSLTAIS